MQIEVILTSAVVGLVSSVVVAYFTARFRVQEERKKWEREFPLRYAQLRSETPELAQATAAQFAVGVLVLNRSILEPREKFFIPQGCRLTAGRGLGNEIDTQCIQTSQRHCAFVADGSNVYVEELGSQNGTFVNGERLHERQKLKKGDLIELGTVKIEFSPIKTPS